ncbi:MAG: hypothetical protein P8Z79_11205 [Sedimentisphaerales bacterium]|jgi:uncharacterized protein YoxC
MVTTAAQEMKRLTEDILSCNNLRLKAVGDLVADTQKTLKRFSTDRKKMAARQKRELVHFVNGLSNDVQGLLKNARDMVEQFRKDSVQMSAEQADRLTNYVNDLVTSVGSMLGDFQKDQRHASKELKDKLTNEINHIQRDVERILEDADKLVREFGNGMAQARKAWESMSAAIAGTQRAEPAKPAVSACGAHHEKQEKEHDAQQGQTPKAADEDGEDC